MVAKPREIQSESECNENKDKMIYESLYIDKKCQFKIFNYE